MRPRIIDLSPTNLIGHFKEMSLADDHTRSLFQGFMPIRNTIVGRVGKKVYDLRVYAPGLDFSTFGPTTVFTKWAAVEVKGTPAEHAGANSFHLSGGLYACFNHQGPASDTPRIFGFIFR
ncbi:GyrI-like domain-containing protein [Neolewinella persica]|uniref:GyrI-like domain-containing protein n=1 Tax=Neolewinella persica TaxID=70998 RepID=UPI0003722D90|nr:GyrI-like domain-containing protein [Neolewinella persica]